MAAHGSPLTHTNMKRIRAWKNTSTWSNRRMKSDDAVHWWVGGLISKIMSLKPRPCPEITEHLDKKSWNGYP